MGQVYQSLVAVEPFTLMVTILNLFVQMYIFKRFFFEKVRSVLAQRQSDADRQLSEASKAREEALHLQQAMREQMLQANQKADALVEQAVKRAQDTGAYMISQARQQVALIHKDADERIALEKKKAIHDARNEISSMALAIAEKVIAGSLNEEIHLRLADAAIDDLEEML